jgi:hypothetical protein
MVEKPTYNDLERKIKQLETEALEYMRREREFSAKRKMADYGHLKRAISLMKINEELNREIKAIKSADKQELEQISQKLSGRVKELNCLYEISSFRKGNDYSLAGVLQEVVDFIPPACRYPKYTCARLIIDDSEFATNNFLYTRWKQSCDITINDERIGTLDVCRLEKIPEFEKNLFIEEEKSLIGAIAESIARLIERDRAEAEIIKCRSKIEELIKQSD